MGENSGWAAWLAYWAMPGRGREIALRHWTFAFCCFFAYVPAVRLTQYWMRNREPYKLKMASFVWNMVLSVLSLIGAVFMLYEDPRILSKMFLSESHYGPYIRQVTAIFALTKGFEFGDTLFLVLRKRPVIFLHWYHHVSVAFYSWHAIYALVPFAHNCALINLSIHTIMYGYYGLGVIIPRHRVLLFMRPYITMMQTIQMFAGICFSGHAILYASLLPEQMFNSWCCLLMYISYAYLFTAFYIENYVKGMKVGMTLFVGTLHVLAVAGATILWRHASWKSLAFEVFAGYALTSGILWITRPTTPTDRRPEDERQAAKIGNKVEHSSKSVVNSLGRVGLMISNCIAVWAREYYELRLREEATKKLLDQDKNNSNLSMVRALMQRTPNNKATADTPAAVLPCPSPDSLLGSASERGWDANPIEKWLAVMCVSLPAVYGFKAYGDIILGFCVHGCLRWVIELHTTGALAAHMPIAKFGMTKMD